MIKLTNLLLLPLLGAMLITGCSNSGSQSTTTTASNQKPADSSGKNPSSSSATTSTSGDFNIGVLLPLSGELAVTGEMMKHGVELAADEYNANGKLPNGKKVGLKVFDDRATPTEGVTAAQRLVNDASVSGVVGPYSSSVALAAKDIFTNGKLPFLSTGVAVDNITDSNFDWYFRAHAYNSLQSRYFADFVANKLKKKKIAMLYVNTDWGKGLSNNVSTILKSSGTEIIASEGFNPGNRDFSSALTKIMSQNPEAIVTMALGTEASIIAKQAMENGIPGNKIIGIGGFDHPDFYKLSAGGAEGISFMYWFDANNPQVPEAKPFAEAFAKKYGIEPDSSAAQAYTAAKVLFEGIIKAGSTDRTAIRDAINATDLGAPIGHIKFDEHHNASTGIFFAQWKDGKKSFLKFD